MAQKRGRSPDDDNCWNCGKPRLLARDCPKPTKKPRRETTPAISAAKRARDDSDDDEGDKRVRFEDDSDSGTSIDSRADTHMSDSEN